jgi:ankyrin repeat protein
MAACRNTGWDVNVHSPIYFFHQPGRREIAMTLLPADDSADSRMLVSKILPLASLPVTIDGPMKDSREGAEGQSAEETIKNLHKELTDSKLEANQLRTANEELTKKLEAAQNNNDAKKADKAAAGKRDPLGEFFAYIDRRSEFLQVDIYNVIRSLYLDGFDINGNDTTGSGRSALIDAINQHGKQIVTVLLSRDIDFQATDSTGDNPLNAACRSEEEGIVRALLEKGSNPNVKDKNGRTPLHEAASRSNKTIVSLLLDKGAPVDSGDADGNTPLHIASSRDIMFLLLQRKADVNARNVKGETPLWYTSSIPEMQLLVENRANVNVFDNYGWGRLHWAVANKAESVIRYLVGAGRADINLQLPDKPTALHIAVLFRHESLVRLLLAAGADRDRRWSGYTPLDYARRDGYQSLIELLQ